MAINFEVSKMSEHIFIFYIGIVLLLILVVGLIIRKVGNSQWAKYRAIEKKQNKYLGGK